MKITNRLNLIHIMRFFICLTLSISFGFANNKAGSTLNSNLSATYVNDFSGETKQDNMKDCKEGKSKNNYHDVMSEISDCTASCCAGNNIVEKGVDSKEESNNQKSKKKSRWCSRFK